MRVLAVLWTVCLVRLCSAGCFGCFGKGKTNDRVTVQAVQGGSREASTGNLRSPPQKPVNFPNDKTLEQVKDKEVQELNKPARDVSGRSSVTTTGSSLEDAEKPLSSQTTTTLPRSRYTDLSRAPQTRDSGETVTAQGGTSSTVATRTGTNSEVDEEQHSYGASQSSGNSSRSPQKPVEQPNQTATSTPQVPPSPANTTSSITSQAGAPKPTTPITLDLSNPDKSKVNMDIKDSNGVVFSEITPKDTSKITTVVDGPTSIWTASGKEEFVFVKHHKKGDSILLTILLKDDNGYTDKYFEKNSSNWNEIKQDEFNGKLATLMGEVLDLSNPDTSKILVHTENASGLSFQGYYPKDTSKITSVVDANKELWNGGANDRCLSCLIYKKGSMELLKIVVVEKNSIAYKYFEKNADGGWKDLQQEEFDKKLKDLKSEVYVLRVLPQLAY
ncbi:signal peptide containing protein [Theileria equi strain WA]|uniref:Signal peptide containing protein n=1 Tax=Theileria equi strain WA TaxID=1537102 RepID=L1LD38_THEEQ|nr:signal peptide containing protein [Theileria equi strain WA]EKX73342.1 signal peptide containing protein [Theileria equi strain WA]|eukprot:XP_004832794.1 signal peptide containing protein [Theileria equi strain WA]